ncbi:MAG: Na+/H+ antiporter NhaA, partial [Ilumatobacteraceae bacterium]
LFSWIAVKLKFGRLPDAVRWGHIIGVGAVAGIGFTVSLFITGLAFTDPNTHGDAKIGIVVASIVAAVLGATILAVTSRRSEPAPASTDLDAPAS